MQETYADLHEDIMAVIEAHVEELGPDEMFYEMARFMSMVAMEWDKADLFSAADNIHGAVTQSFIDCAIKKEEQRRQDEEK